MTEDNIAKIIVALISLLGIITGAILGYIGRSKKQVIIDTQREQKQADLFDSLIKEMGEIKKRLDTHNKYAEKFGDIEKAIVGIKKDIEYIRKDTNEKSK